MDSAWESWIRPVLLIAVAGLAGLAWYFGWVPDAAIGAPLGLGAASAAAVAVGLRVRVAAASPFVARLSWATLAGALAVALWSPWVVLGPGGELAGADLTVEAASVTVPPTGDGPDRYRVYFHGRPAFGSANASVHLELAAPGAAGAKASRTGRLDTQQLQSGRGGGKAVQRRDIAWPLTFDLSAGATLSVREDPPASVAWPTHVEIHRAPPLPAAPIAAGLAVTLLALALEAQNKRRARSWLSTLAAASPFYTLLFGLWYAPGNLTATVFGATLVSAVGGTIVSYGLLPLFRRRLAPPLPAVAVEDAAR